MAFELESFDLRINLSTKDSRYYWRHREARIAEVLTQRKLWTKRQREKHNYSVRKRYQAIREALRIKHCDALVLNWLWRLAKDETGKVSQLRQMQDLLRNAGKLSRRSNLHLPELSKRQKSSPSCSKRACKQTRLALKRERQQ